MEQLAGLAAEVGVVEYDDSQCRCGKRMSLSSSPHCGISSSPHCGISSNSFDAENEPRTKKPMIHNPNYDSLIGNELGLNGYSKVKLPIDFTAAMNLTAGSDSPLLRRCVSDPYNSPGDGNKNSAGGLEHDGVLRRCISDPYHSPGVALKNQAGVGAICSPARGMSPGGGGGLPPLYPGTTRLNDADVVTPTKGPTECLTGQSPDSLRLKRIKERVKEMAQLWVDVVNEEDETLDVENCNASAGTGIGTAATAHQDEDDKEHEEQIGVEKVGDGLKIKLRCPCGSGYELLISGHCCYYKLL